MITRPWLAVLAAVCVLGVATVPTSATVRSQDSCDFTLGFKALRDQIPEIVGECLENERFNLENGNAEQRTTGGLLVWRKADNWTAFTDGSTTWINGPHGLASRPNSGPFFSWEGEPPPSAPSQSQPAPPPAQPTIPPQAPPPPPPAPVAPAPQSVSGRGQRVSDRFSLEQGLAIFRLQHSGKRNFAIWLLDPDGRRIDLLVNEIGDFNGSTAVGIAKPGSHVFEVTADGSWSVSIEQPRPASAPGTPITFSGRGKQVTTFFTLPSGLKVAQMRHSGQRNFAIWLLDRNGRRVDLLVNEIGVFDGSKAVSATGIHVFNVEADGDWTITIQ